MVKVNKLKSFDSETLIIVDVQKSFSKFFNDKYLKNLKDYTLKFDNVYQIWDNHVEKDTDNDYLYNKVQEEPDVDDLYKFHNQVDLIEKRYNYDVDVNFYKKVLNNKTYNLLKEKENNKTLKIGDIYHTKYGTILVYIGNNHVWYHCPKKLYILFKKLTGTQITMVGGSLSECLLDVEICAKSLGVKVNLNYNYIYSATECPVQKKV